jgi:hypothetical protein
MTFSVSVSPTAHARGTPETRRRTTDTITGVYMYICVLMCIYVYVCMYRYIYIYVCVYMCVYIIYNFVQFC